MVLYFEPQILYGITSPNKMRRCQAIQVHWKAEIARQLAPTLLKRRVYKMASHGGAGQSEEKQSLNRATVFLMFRYFCYFVILWYLNGYICVFHRKIDLHLLYVSNQNAQLPSLKIATTLPSLVCAVMLRSSEPIMKST